MLSWAVRGRYIYDSDTTTNAILLFQFDCAVRANFIDGTARFYIAAGLWRKTHIRYVFFSYSNIHIKNKNKKKTKSKKDTRVSQNQRRIPKSNYSLSMLLFPPKISFIHIQIITKIIITIIIYRNKQIHITSLCSSADSFLLSSS